MIQISKPKYPQPTKRNQIITDQIFQDLHTTPADPSAVIYPAKILFCPGFY